MKDKEQFFKELREKVKAVMDTWPDWKRNVDWLNNSPTVKIPRQPVIDEDKIDF